MSIRQLTQMAMLAAISIILVFFIRFPIIPAAPFLEYTPGEVPLMMAAFLFGPISALILTVVSSIVQGITVSAHSGPIGIVMNILSTGSFVVVAGLIYRYYNKTLIAILAGITATCISMIGWNLIFTPIFMGVPREIVIGMILPVFLPFNLIRACVNSVIAYTAWRAVGTLLERQVKR